MPSSDTLWPLDEHTRGKHLVLRHYLNAWLPILGTTRGRIVFIDGFAGPGEYHGGELGSPLIALEAYARHHAAARMREVQFLFIEAREDRATHLEQLVHARYTDPPPNCVWEVVCGECEPTVLRLLDGLEARGQRLAPSLMMLDPFGAAGLSMRLIERFLRHPQTEVYISFMYDSFRRFKDTPEFARHLDALFGVPEWRSTLGLDDPEEARRATYLLYASRLRAAGATQLVPFDLYRDNRLIYSIFFGTKHLLGCDRMKQAVWRAAPSGSFEFRGVRSQQLSLELTGPNYALLREELVGELAGKGWIAIDDVERFMQSDRTLFHSGQFKKEGLKRLEEAKRIDVQRQAGALRGTFTPGTLIRVLGSMRFT